MNREGTKWLYLLDILVISISAIALVAIIGYIQPLIIAPVDNFNSSDNSILFSFKNADKLYIDDNIGFTHPREIDAKENIEIKLNPGVYYWKVEGIGSSDVRKLTVEAVVDLRLRKTDNKIDVVNAGNVPLNVSVYDNEVLVDELFVDVDSSKLSVGDKFIGRQHG